MDKYGVVDIGSNTVRLEVYEVNDQYFQLFFKRKEFLGLSSYVKKGEMSDEGVDKLIELLKDYETISSLLGVEKLFIFATAAIRNARNSKEIIQRLEENINSTIDLISGEREAELGFKAVTNRFGLESAVTIDIGGGSTELSVYEDGQFVISKSFNDGGLSLYSEFVEGILPTEKEINNIVYRINRYIIDENISDKPHKTICGVGGSIRLLNKLYKKYYETDNEDKISVKKFKKIFRKMLKGDMEIIKMILQIAPERIHSIIPASLILMVICDHLSVKNILVCDSGVREGYLSIKLEGEEDDK